MAKWIHKPTLQDFKVNWGNNGEYFMSQPTQKKLIQKTPGVCGGNPRIRDTRIAVWTLVSFRQQGVLDEEASHYLVEFADTQGREYSIATLFLSLIA